jgi:hypothetical protein
MEQQKPDMKKTYVRNTGDYSEAGFTKHYNEVLQDWKNFKIVDEFWIGKEDYIIRQWKEVLIPQAAGSSSTGFKTGPDIRKYYDFNAPIEIKAPLDPQGNLLPGWAAAGQ